MSFTSINHNGVGENYSSLAVTYQICTCWSQGSSGQISKATWHWTADSIRNQETGVSSTSAQPSTCCNCFGFQPNYCCLTGVGSPCYLNNLQCLPVNTCSLLKLLWPPRLMPSADLHHGILSGLQETAQSSCRHPSLYAAIFSVHAYYVIRRFKVFLPEISKSPLQVVVCLHHHIPYSYLV